MTDVMLDFETLGTSGNAPVVQIGACYFDRASGEIGRTFECNVDLETMVQSGAQIDAATVYWWLSQSKEAQDSILKLDRKPAVYAFKELNEFLQGAKTIWSHAIFDFVILINTLKRLNIKPTFTYKSARDIRTLQDLAGYPAGQPRQGIHHNGLDDCKFQVSYCTAAFKALNLK